MPNSATLTEKSPDYLDIDGIRLERLDVRPADARTPAIVMLHEGLGSVSAWRDFPDKLARATGHAVHVYSRQGHGASSPLGGPRAPRYMHPEALDVLPRVIDGLGLKKPVLFGHSDGASIALIHAAAHPEAVGALILEAPHVFVEDISVASIAAIRETALTSDLISRLARHHQAAEAMFWAWNNIWLAAEFRDWNIVAGLERITCPVLLIQGRDDEYGTPAQLEAIAAHVTGKVETVLLDNCRHAPHRDRTDEVLALTKELMDRVFSGPW